MARLTSIAALVSVVALGVSAEFACAADPAATVTVHGDRPGIKVSQTLYGIFFEEINRAGEGGLYAELERNRSFEDSADEPVGWTLAKASDADGAIAIDTSQPLNENNTHALRLEA